MSHNLFYHHEANCTKYLSAQHDHHRIMFLTDRKQEEIQKTYCSVEHIQRRQYNQRDLKHSTRGIELNYIISSRVQVTEQTQKTHQTPVRGKDNDFTMTRSHKTSGLRVRCSLLKTCPRRCLEFYK